jgi:hypothetical protein
MSNIFRRKYATRFNEQDKARHWNAENFDSSEEKAHREKAANFIDILNLTSSLNLQKSLDTNRKNRDFYIENQIIKKYEGLYESKSAPKESSLTLSQCTGVDYDEWKTKFDVTFVNELKERYETQEQPEEEMQSDEIGAGTTKSM